MGKARNPMMVLRIDSTPRESADSNRAPTAAAFDCGPARCAGAAATAFHGLAPTPFAVHRIPEDSQIRAVGEDGGWLATTVRRNEDAGIFADGLEIWDFAVGRHEGVVSTNGSVQSISSSETHKALVLIVWNREEPRRAELCVADLRGAKLRFTRTIELAASGDWPASCVFDREGIVVFRTFCNARHMLAACDLRNGRQLWEIETEASSIQCSRNRRYLVTTINGGQALLDPRSGRALMEFPGACGTAGDCNDFSDDEVELVFRRGNESGEARVVRRFRIADGSQVGPDRPFDSFQFSMRDTGEPPSLQCFAVYTPPKYFSVKAAELVASLLPSYWRGVDLRASSCEAQTGGNNAGLRVPMTTPKHPM